MNSNYRQFYANDPNFFRTVLKKETAPFEFKLMLFMGSNNTDRDRELRDEKMHVMSYLT